MPIHPSKPRANELDVVAHRITQWAHWLRLRAEFRSASTLLRHGREAERVFVSSLSSTVPAIRPRQSTCSGSRAPGAPVRDKRMSCAVSNAETGLKSSRVRWHVAPCTERSWFRSQSMHLS